MRRRKERLRGRIAFVLAPLVRGRQKSLDTNLEQCYTKNMKKVISNLKTEVLEAKDTHKGRYYGVMDERGVTGFICRKLYDKGDYEVRCADGVTKGNAFVNLSAPTLSEVVTLCLETHIRFDVFEFVTATELFGWLARNS